jgi:hypothetical protein
MRGQFTHYGGVLKAGGWLLLLSLFFAAFLAGLLKSPDWLVRSARDGRLITPTYVVIMQFISLPMVVLFGWGFFDAAKRFIKAVNGKKTKS